MDAPDSLTAFLHDRLPEALTWLERWVGMNSYTANAAGVNRVGESTAEAFQSLGFVPSFVPSAQAEYGRHLFLHRRGTNAGPPVVLVTHLDTVFPPEEEAANDFHWRPEPDEGRIYGPGTVDIKGGTALLWLVLHALAKEAPEQFAETTWIIAASASEEALSADFGRAAHGQCDRAQAVLVFEGGLLQGREFTLVEARKGKADYRISASGRAAHAGSAHAEGRNAITALAAAVLKAAALTDYARDLTVNVGEIHGGTVVNRVPHEAAASLEMRAFSPDVLAEARSAVEALGGPSPDVAGVQMAVETLGATAAWPGGPETAALLDVFAAEAEALGFTVHRERRGGLSDANYLHDLGPTVDGLGPSGGAAHCSERSADGSKVPEFVEPGSFVPKAALVVRAIRRWLEKNPL